MADPILIQKQIKDNSEDLHNFVRDLKLWEEEMKRKDSQLSNDNREEILPPVRRAKLPKKDGIKTVDKDQCKSKRILSYDYKSWEKFDVDKACDDVDNADSKNKSEDEMNENDTKEEEKYLKEKAMYEKELGNQHVKACKWDAAIEAYSRAITAYPKDPIFFANRGLCYLKKKKYNNVEDDCTESLKLDSTYVKAYMRRAAAREALGRLEDARHDLTQVLLLEPNNSQAQRDLERIKAPVISKAKNKNTGTVKETEKTLLKKTSNQEEVHSLMPAPQTLETSRTTNSKEIINQRLSESGSKITLKQSSNEPDWEPCSSLIEPVSKPPHLRSKKILKRIEIHDVGFGMPKHVCPREIQKPEDILPKSESSVTTAAETQAPSGLKPRSVLTVATVSAVRDVPPPPKTSVQFHTSWNSIRTDRSQCYKFLRQIPGEDLPEIFKESLESRMFSGIVELLATEFIAAGEPVLPYLRGLCSVRRFSTLALFMSSADKSYVLMLLEHCTNKGECSEEEICHLRRLYEV